MTILEEMQNRWATAPPPKQAAQSKMLAIIPARAGSKRLLGKNTRVLAGLSLIEWAQDAAVGASLQAVITTDDERVMALADNSFGFACIRRPPALATDAAHMSDVVQHVLRLYPEYDAFCLLQPTSPLRTAGDILEAKSMFADQCGTSLISVAKGSNQPNGAIYMGRSSLFLEHGLFVEDGIILRNGLEMHAETLRYEMPVERSIDVDTLEDFERCEDYLLGPRKVYADGHVGRERAA